ncbi:2-methylfumaryl-CoA isomerase [Williamsia sp. 1138]|uniref:CoA transferase n=1 Tax=Williamsia sp. 1138 TaxID=1903117 RepID=UPI000A11C997|nr:CoA transferase [Williamsia sp. 1138]OZG29380.1 2-methylfumaryl-CoA isomerase [Williamsia sp. 1138]
MNTGEGAGPLAGLRIVEVSSFVASPLCGLTLSQLGAQVIRVDPIGGASDYRRWPVTADGESIYWTGLNRGKHSIACDFRNPDAQKLIQQLATAPGPGGGIFVTNAGGRDWMGHEALAALRDDVITLEILGKRDGTAGVDYTVNAALGFPQVTGPGGGQVVNHVLPAWDIACGLHASTALLAAVRRRDHTGVGSQITLPLEDVALATAGALGYLTEVMINGRQRQATGNAIYGTYGIDFETADHARFMIVALTNRHFRDLVGLTETGAAVDALEAALDTDFRIEGERYEYRDALTALFARWFRRHTAAHVYDALRKTSVLFEQYRSFTDVVESDALESNPLFSTLDQPRIGRYLAAGHPARFDRSHLSATPASAVGEDSGSVVAEVLGLSAEEIAGLFERGVIG